MNSEILQRLADEGIKLVDLKTTPAPAALGDYVPFKIIDNLLYISGQVSMKDGQVMSGKLGLEFTLEDGVKAAEMCAVNILSQALYALEDLGRVEEVVKLGGFVNTTPDFTEIPQVINGASRIMRVAFNDNGNHVRFAVGCQSLPRNAAVEIEAILKIKS